MRLSIVTGTITRCLLCVSSLKHHEVGTMTLLIERESQSVTQSWRKRLRNVRIRQTKHMVTEESGDGYKIEIFREIRKLCLEL